MKKAEIYYYREPIHGLESSEGKDLYFALHKHSDKGNKTQVTIDEQLFQENWAKVSTESVSSSQTSELERLFSKYNDYSTNPLSIQNEGGKEFPYVVTSPIELAGKTIPVGTRVQTSSGMDADRAKSADGEAWRPVGYQNIEKADDADKPPQHTLKEADVHHTSMSVGDIIKVEDRYYFVADVGFLRLYLS